MDVGEKVETRLEVVGVCGCDKDGFLKILVRVVSVQNWSVVEA